MKLSYQIISPSPEKEKNLPPVILLHGRMDSKKTWVNLAPIIAKDTGRKVICPDARNHGDSPWSNDMSFEVLTQDLENFMEEQKIERAILIGHSMGGRTAMTFALRKPKSVEKIIVEDMVTTNYTSTAKMSVMYIMNLLRQSLSAIPPDADEETAKTAIIDYIKSQLPSLYDEKKTMFFDMDTMPIKKEDNVYKWQANFDVLENMLNSEKNDQVLSGVYSGDALFLYGTESFFDVPGDENIKKLFPKAVLRPVEGVGHLIHQDCPDEFLKNVITFINGSEMNSSL